MRNRNSQLLNSKKIFSAGKTESEVRKDPEILVKMITSEYKIREKNFFLEIGKQWIEPEINTREN